jgi:peroxiredoxin
VTWNDGFVAAHDPMMLPDGLPAPVDDGAADHLPGVAVPLVALLASDGRKVRLDHPGALARTVVYAYPRTGRPGEDPLVADWDLIPGARGCTPETCAFRDHHADLRAAGAEIYGLSTQSTDYQREAVQRLHLPFALLSDSDLQLTRALGVPTFDVAGETLLKRLTLVLRGGFIEHVFYPVFPPDRHAGEVLAWLQTHPVA